MDENTRKIGIVKLLIEIATICDKKPLSHIQKLELKVLNKIYADNMGNYKENIEVPHKFVIKGKLKEKEYDGLEI